MARLLPLAHFGGRAALSRSWGYFAAHLRTLIWGLSFIKCFFSIFSPENASQISFSISEETAPPTDPGQQPPKRASANERPLTQGGRGPFPATLCVRAFSRESLDPRPGPGGKDHAAGANLRRSKPGPPARGRTVLRTLRVGGTEAASGRSAPLPRLPGGGPHFSREMGRKRAGAAPLDPQFYGPLAAARSFWRSCRIVPVVGLFRCPSSYPDLGAFFHKMLFQHIFPRKCVPNQF